MQLNSWLGGKRGRAAALAAFLRVPSSMVSDMASGKKQVPLEHCPFIEEFTERAVSCEELRPDKLDYFRLLRSRAIDRPVLQHARPIPPTLREAHHG